ncbi:MAG: 23S rRNA (uracil(1939)-C(5))-methyltransferase RlmD [Firmicutes bacterium HGW-Firmicutes-1]|nr:MAG: 23S rRNA (uracil(1939)-C(5))-methyltransferase RlmD [Firmicutes bacterium HGW-Firmicutes-1]
MPVIKNECYSLTIDDLNVDGDGVGKIDGYALFVPGAVPGDKVYVKVIKVNKNLGFAKIEEIILPSKDRCAPTCKVASKCGGCQLQHINYNAQLEFKRNKVEQTLKRIGGFNHIKVEPTIGMEDPYHYRNKAQYPVGEDVFGNIQIGFYVNRSHRIVPIETCAIQNVKNDEVIEAVKSYMIDNGVKPYNEENHKGLIRHIVTRYSKHKDVLQVTLVVNGRKIPKEEELIKRLSKLDWIEGILININSEKTNVILGNETKVLYGKRHIVDNIGDVSYRISPTSFYQVNPIQTEKLYKTVLDYAQLTGEEIVWDAYCGIGTIALYLASKAKYVYGVEIVPEAIEDAHYNMELNKIDNADFFVGKAEQVIEKKYQEGIRADVIVVDPPRKGCDQKLLDTIIHMSPKRVVYVSCDPATLARDVKILSEAGYEISAVQPVDMFPMTTHVETCCLLKRL